MSCFTKKNQSFSPLKGKKSFEKRKKHAIFQYTKLCVLGVVAYSIADERKKWLLNKTHQEAYECAHNSCVDACILYTCQVNTPHRVIRWMSSHWCSGSEKQNKLLCMQFCFDCFQFFHRLFTCFLLSYLI